MARPQARRTKRQGLKPGHWVLIVVAVLAIAFLAHSVRSYVSPKGSKLEASIAAKVQAAGQKKAMFATWRQPDGSYKCPVCGQSFPRAGETLGHLQQAHPDYLKQQQGGTGGTGGPQRGGR